MVMDLFTRAIVGFSVLTNHSRSLVVNALLSAIHHSPRPFVFHSDNGSEYDSVDLTTIVASLETLISRSVPGYPWENGYQESFYDKLKVDLGDPERFDTLGELVAEIYRTVHTYNTTCIHTALKMPPAEFAKISPRGTIKIPVDFPS